MKKSKDLVIILSYMDKIKKTLETVLKDKGIVSGKNLAKLDSCRTLLYHLIKQYPSFCSTQFDLPRVYTNLLYIIDRFWKIIQSDNGTEVRHEDINYLEDINDVYNDLSSISKLMSAADGSTI